MNNAALRQAYKTIDDIMQEVCLAEEETLKLICAKLREVKDPGLTVIIGILQDWGKTPAAELKERALKL